MHKKMLAAMFSILFLAGTVLATTAYTVGDYPSFLFEEDEDGNTEFNAYIVVGEDAATADVVGGIDLAMALAAEQYNLIPLEQDEVVEGESENIVFGQALTSEFETPLKDDDVPVLKDSYVDFQGDSYDIHEEIVLDSNKLKIQTSLTSDEDYTDMPVMEVGRGDILYYYKFDDEIDTGDVTSDESLEIEILGKTINIVDFDNDRIKVRLVEDHWMDEGTSITSGDYTVTLEMVGENDVVLVEVEEDGETDRDIVKKGEEERILDLQVRVIEVFYTSKTTGTSSAIIAFGEEVTKSYDDGDAFIGEDDDDPDWVWIIQCSDDAVEKPVFGVSYDRNKDDKSDNPPEIDESIVLPNNYVYVLFDSLTEDEWGEYRIWHSDSFDLSDVSGYGTSEDVFIIRSVDDEEGLHVDSDNDADTDLDYYTKEIYIYEDAGDLLVFYFDEDDRDVHKSDIEVLPTDGYKDIAELRFDDTDARIQLHEALGASDGENLKFIFEDVIGTADEEIIIDLEDVAGDLDRLGSLSDDAEAGDVHVTGITVNKDVGTYDEEVLTEYGNIILSPEGNANDDRVKLLVPANQVKAKVIIASEVSEEEGEFVKEAVPITRAVAKLDTEIPDPTTIDAHLILVGDAAVNRIAASAMGVDYPTYGASGEFPYGEGEAIIKLYGEVFKEGQQVILVAGWSADDTRLACLVAQQWEEFLKDRTETAVKITGTPTNPVITPLE